MNIKSLILTGIGMGIIITGAIINRRMYNAFNKEVENGLDKAVLEKFGNELADAKIDLSMAKGAAHDIYKAEAEAARIAANANPEYTEALAVMKTNKEQIDILKKSLKIAQEGNSTQVAVGTGNSAVAVNIKDTTQITQLQSDISKLQAEMNKAEAKKNTIWNIEHKKVCDARTPEQLEAINKVKAAEKNLDHVIFDKEMYKNTLKNDPEFMDKIQKRAYIAHYNPFMQILSAACLTIPPIICTVYVWKTTVEGIQLYLALKKGV